MFINYTKKKYFSIYHYLKKKQKSNSSPTLHQIFIFMKTKQFVKKFINQNFLKLF